MHRRGNSTRRQFVAATGASAAVIGLSGCVGSSDEDIPDDYEPVSFELNTFTRDDLADVFGSAEIITDQWEEKLGADIEFTPTPIPEAVDLMTQGDYDMHTNGFSGTLSRVDPEGLLRSYTSWATGILPLFENEDYDDAYTRLRQETEFEERQQAAFECQEIILNELPVIPTYHRNSIAILYRHHFENWLTSPGPSPHWHRYSLENVVRIDDDRAAMIYADDTHPPSLNPLAIGTGIEMNSAMPTHETLVTIHPETGEIESALAETFEIVDNETFEFTIREGATFHDGESVTGEDVKFTVEYYQEWNGAPSYAEDYSVVDDVEVIDERSVRISLEEPNTPWLSNSASRFNILPKHVWENVVEDHGLEHPTEYSGDDMMIGCGPFEHVFEESDERIIWEPYDDHPMEVDFDELIWLSHGTVASIIGNLGSGTADFSEVGGFSPSHADDAEDNDDLEVIESEDFSYQTIYINPDRRPFDNVEVRRAFAHAVDMQEVIAVVFQGRAEPVRSPIAHHVDAVSDWHNPDVAVYDGGEAEARRILEEEGFMWGSSGQLYMPPE